MSIQSATPQLTLPAGQQNLSLSLRVIGQREVVLRARIAPSEPLRFRAIEGAVDYLDVRVPRPATSGPMTVNLPLIWTGNEPPPVETPRQIALNITTLDGAPRDGFSLEPDNRARVWETLHLRISAPLPARLEIESALLLLNGRARARELVLCNAGESPLQLQPPLLPVGFEIASAGASHGQWTLPAQTRRSWTVRALAGAPSGETRVALRHATGEALGEIRLLVPAPAVQTARTRYVIGVDFGTSGTSIYKRDGRDDRLPAVALQDPRARAGVDDAKRFPTVLYVSFQNGNESGFYIGYEALQKQQQKEGDSPGLFVREIKSLLRTGDEPFAAQFGPNYRVDLLLRRFLLKLYQQIIEPQLEGGRAASVAWNFSLPVLDSHQGGAGTLFEMQKRRLENAIHDAQYVKTGDALEFFTEPFCAAVYLLLEHGNYRYPKARPPRDGDWACIFDSGGGTTDVVLGRLRLEQNQMRFEAVSTLGGYRDGANKVTTFGGELLTRKTAIYLSVWQKEGDSAQDSSYKLLLHEVARLSREGALGGRDPQNVGDDLRSVAAMAANNEELFTQPTVTLGTRIKPNPWLEFSQIWQDVERFKRQLASLALPGATANLPFPSRESDGKVFPVSIVRREFDEVVVNKRLASMGAAMTSEVFSVTAVAAPAEVGWVFGVGGNCRVRRVQDWLQEFFPQWGAVQDLTLVQNGVADESDRMLAVAGGAVWANKASRDNTLPYGIRVERAGVLVFEAQIHAAIADVAPRETICPLGFGDQTEFRCYLNGQISGQKSVDFDGEIGRFVVCNRQSDEGADAYEIAARNITVRIAMEGRTLRAWSDESGAMQEVFAFSF